MGAFLSRVDVLPAQGKKNDADDAKIDHAEAGGDGNHDQAKPSLLSRHAGTIVAVTFVVYAILAVVLTEFGCGGGGTMNVKTLATWMFGVLLSVSIALLSTLAGILLAFVSGLFTWSHHGCLALMCAAALAMGLVSSLVALARPAYGGICHDAFGVETMSTTWYVIYLCYIIMVCLMRFL